MTKNSKVFSNVPEVTEGVYCDTYGTAGVGPPLVIDLLEDFEATSNFCGAEGKHCGLSLA